MTIGALFILRNKVLTDKLYIGKEVGSLWSTLTVLNIVNIIMESTISDSLVLSNGIMVDFKHAWLSAC